MYTTQAALFYQWKAFFETAVRVTPMILLDKVLFTVRRAYMAARTSDKDTLLSRLLMYSLYTFPMFKLPWP